MAVVLNETVNFKATFTDTDGTSRDVTAEASWSPSASFSKGTIGVYPVTVSHKGLTASSQITVVKEKGMDDITVNEKTVTVTFWDHGQQDGDMIDILINGEVVFPGITLTNAHQSRTITMNADIIVVGFKALNVGSIPPNTASVTFTSVTAGKPTQTYSLNQNQEANMNVNYKP
jgi:archaellum component FlaF (FlaF/FlaG flagellin family)